MEEELPSRNKIDREFILISPNVAKHKQSEIQKQSSERSQAQVLKTAFIGEERNLLPKIRIWLWNTARL